MSAVCEWVLTQDRPGDLGPGEVRQALDNLNVSNNAGVAVGALEVSKTLASVWEMEERTRSSIYATAQTVIWPWADPGVAASARPPKGKEGRSEEHTSELQSLMRISYAVFCLKKKKKTR